ncbi:hypothetical protein [Putridiphycobacter roseus]|nr:hypothetical protein [Putridiphycobacter roseus]
MEREFEFRRKNLLLAVGILFVLTGFLGWRNAGLQSILPYVWWIGGLIWIYRYWSFYRNGFLKVNEQMIQLNFANFRGIQQYRIVDIEDILITSKHYCLILKTRGKIKIDKGNFDNNSIQEVDNIFISIRDKIK